MARKPQAEVEHIVMPPSMLVAVLPRHDEYTGRCHTRVKAALVS